MKKRTLIWLGIVVGFLVFMFATPPFNFLLKPPRFAHAMAMNIAVGLEIKDDGFSLARSMERPSMNIPSCKVDSEHWQDLAPYWRCIVSFEDPYRTGCGLWYKPDCVSVRGEAYLLQRPELLAKTLDAMEHPCKYLPTAPEIDRWTLPPKTHDPAYNEQMLQSMRAYLKGFWHEAQCDTNPEKYRGKVALTLYDVKRPVYVIVRPKE